MKVGIIGAGAFGTALAISVANGGKDVILWGFDGDMAKNMQKGRENDNLLGVKVPENVLMTADMAKLKDCAVWLIATPSEFFDETMQKSREFWTNQPIIICTKGMDNTGKFMSEVLTDVFADTNSNLSIGVLSGPQFAAEVAAGKPTGSTIAGNAAVTKLAAQILPGFYLEKTDDIIGVEICGAGKNSVAILMGYLDGKGMGENERALKITETFGEIVRLGRALGAKDDTFFGLSGLGDLFLSATSKTSRNYNAGYDFSRGLPLEKGITTEGVTATRGLLKIAKKAGISMPNIEFLAGVISNAA